MINGPDISFKVNYMFNVLNLKVRCFNVFKIKIKDV